MSWLFELRESREAGKKFKARESNECATAPCEARWRTQKSGKLVGDKEQIGTNRNQERINMNQLAQIT